MIRTRHTLRIPPTLRIRLILRTHLTRRAQCKLWEVPKVLEAHQIP